VSSPLRSLAARYYPELDAELRNLLAPAGELYSDYYNMLQYHMGWLDIDLQPVQGYSGKRVRPLLCLLCCASAGGDVRQALPAAAAIEALHNFSLLHDDIEDNSDTRRGQPTVWKLWGMPHALNAGDGLFALSHLAFSRLPERGVPAELAFAVRQVFDQTCLTLTHGQFLDMRFETRLDVTVDEYMTMIEGKTAALIATASYLGALLGGASEASASCYWELGRHLGLTFQVRDDILGIWGDADVTGKSTSSDIVTRKKTLPVVFGLERSEALRDLYASDRLPPEKVAWVVQTLEELGAREMAEAVATEHHHKAKQALRASKAAGQAGEALRELSMQLLSRAS
jgi:geranylgeranyl diphosphate synthase type I